ncbi:MAG: cyclic nucleotide-binding domain-containing protein [Thiotrichales bacterium]|jgi:CRP/FNR family transcriptional regulator|nr:cyclic nucleotide-binding domain-containing protein [Thiotrichales bacterium]MBT3613384.1 cyclic nucleotide-binding domain-containing protein [Thiotrichales bacterium]MBT3752483.1 cyclic nucleotide-binding domain-containing protein [Thiotrichales bacterium]MBT3837442.1 cyclic nucleotide-binding domain-containing protein [Thiotrichales bacterium]MBT4260948.1 cyclic nucleotide-binding domain-containing protein [Thiotrichales bacterium]
MTIKKYSANERIFQQGMRGEWAGIVREGKVEIYIQDDNGATEVVATLNKGEIFGDLALLSDSELRAASARALEYSEIQQLSRKDMNTMLTQAPPLLRAIVMALVKRMKSVMEG